MFHDKIKDHVKMQICKMCKFFEEKLSVNVRACQQQLNVVDCWVYTVANVFHLLLGVNISAKKICNDQIRPHLLKCHRFGDFNEFSLNKPDERSTLPRKTIKFDVFCNYRFSWVWYHSKNKNLNMAQCDSCQNCYFRKSEDIPDA